MKNQRAIIGILASVLWLMLLGCEGMAELFHGPKPEKPPVTCTLTFHLNGGTGTIPETITVTAGTVVNLPDQGGFSKGQDIFAGWSEGTSNATIYPALSPITVHEDMIFYARWIPYGTPTHTVTFHANGASGTAPPQITGLYSGMPITIPNQGSLSMGDKTFGGWNTQQNGSGLHYAAGAVVTVTETIIFYAQWINALPGATLAEQLAYIRSADDDGAVYDIAVSSNEHIGPQTISTMGRNITVNIHSANPADVKTIQLTSAGYLFRIEDNITLTLQNIVLSGINSNTSALVHVGLGGKLILNAGSKITQNTNIGNAENVGAGGGIALNNGTLEMNDGAEIVGNKVFGNFSAGGGICINENSNVAIHGGTISENIAGNETSTWYSYGGGIYIGTNSTVTMFGGTISKNQCTGIQALGGGIYAEDSVFTKRAASGSSTSGIIFGGTGTNANTVTGIIAFGHAIYRYSVSLSERNTTLTNYDEITTLNNVGWE